MVPAAQPLVGEVGLLGRQLLGEIGLRLGEGCLGELVGYVFLHLEPDGGFLVGVEGLRYYFGGVCAEGRFEGYEFVGGAAVEEDSLEPVHPRH